MKTVLKNKKYILTIFLKALGDNLTFSRNLGFLFQVRILSQKNENLLIGICPHLISYAIIRRSHGYVVQAGSGNVVQPSSGR